MKMNSIKRLCLGLGTVALLILMTACATGSQTADTGGGLPTVTPGSPTVTPGNPTVTPGNPTVTPGSPTVTPAYTGTDGTLSIDAESGTLHVTPGSVATGNPDKVIVTVNGTKVETQEDSAHVITLTSPYPIKNANIEVLLISPVDLDLSMKDGNINVDGVQAKMHLKGKNATITANAVTLMGKSHLDVNNQYGGTILFKGSLGPNSNSLFEVDRGFVSVQLPADAAFHLHATSQSGTVSTDFSVPSHSLDSIDADIGGASSPVLTATANAGTISVTKQ